MKLMYSIIIVIVAIGIIIFLLKTSKHATTNIPTTNRTTMSTQPSSDTGTSTAAAPAVDMTTELVMTTVKEGSGEGAKDGDTVVVNYTGYLADGTKFDSSLDHGTPFTFTLGAGQVIAGWDIGVKGMKKGETRKLVIPAKYAYGEKGFPGVIPPNATLAFTVDLIDINPAPSAAAQ
jgi:FKBP-type peptidyl-prolyl cis-trans isomerase